jgi:hypothetical protein
MTEVKYQARVYTNAWSEAICSFAVSVRYTITSNKLAEFWELVHEYTKYDQERYEMYGEVKKIEMERLEDGFIVSTNMLYPFDQGEGQTWVQQGWVDKLSEKETKPFVPMEPGDKPISEDDEGKLSMMMVLVPEEQVLVISFSKSLKWIAFDARTVDVFLEDLQKKAIELKGLV